MTDPDWTNAKLIPYDHHEQAFAHGVVHGFASIDAMLRDQPAIVANTPGFRTAMALVSAATHEQRSSSGIKAMRHAARHGVDVATHLVASQTDGILVKPMDRDHLGMSL